MSVSMADELADARTYISDLRHQLAVRADENERLEYELRTANERGDAWRDELRSDEARITELEAERDDLLDERYRYVRAVEQAEAEAAQTKAELRRMETRVSNYRAALELFKRKPALGLGEAEADLSEVKWSGQSIENARRQLKEHAHDAEREPDGYDPLGTERWVDGEPSNDISQWETNGTSID